MNGYLSLALRDDRGKRGSARFMRATVDEDGYVAVVDADRWLRQALDAGRVRWALFRGGQKDWRVVEIGARQEEGDVITLRVVA